MLMQEEDLRKFLDKHFERHYKLRIEINNMLERNPNHISNTKFQYRFEKNDDGNIFTTILDVPYVENGNFSWHNIYMIFTDNEVMFGNKNETSKSVIDFIYFLNKDYIKTLEKFKRKKEIQEKLGNNRLIKKFIQKKKETSTQIADDEIIQQ